MSQTLDGISDSGNQKGQQQVAHNEIFTQLYDAPPKQGDGSVVNGVGRVVDTAAGGIVEAGRAALANPADYMDDAAMGAGIGFGLGAISKAGRFGPHAAAAIGAGLLGSWAYAEVTGDRWNGFGSAMADSFRSSENLSANKAIAARSLGAFTVEFGVMGVTGAGGAMAGRKFTPEGWGTRAIENVKAGSLTLTSGFKEGGLFSKPTAITESSGMGRGPRTPELVEGNGFASGAKKTGTADIMVDAANLIKETKVVTSLADIQTAVLEGKVKSDAVALGIKTEIQTILAENQGLGGRRQALGQEVAALEAQRTSILQSRPEQLAFESARRSLAEIQTNRETLARLEQQKSTMEQQLRAKEQGGDKADKGKGKKGEGEGSNVNREELGKLKQEIRDLKESTSEEALLRARARVHDTQAALEAKKATAETDAHGLTATIEGKKTELGLLEERGQQLVTSMTDAVSRYTQRLDAIRQDNGLIKPATAAEQAAAKSVPKPAGEKGQRPTDGASQARQVVDRGNGNRGDRQTTRVEEVKIDPNSPQGRALRADQAYAEAKSFSDKFVWERSLAKATQDKADIMSGKKTFTDAEAKRLALETAENQIAKSTLELGGEQAKYAQTLKRISQYGRAIEQAYIADKDFPITEAVKKLEALMEPIDHIWSPPPGSKGGELARPGRHGKTAEMRLPDIQKHLEGKIEHVDGNQSKRLGAIRDNPTIKEIKDMYEGGQLPEGGSIIFIKGDKTVLMQADLPNKGFQNRGPQGVDAAQRARHAETTPAFTDISRLRNGDGPDGAGLFRFIGLEKEISGAIVFQPVMKDGQPVLLRNNGKGKPMVKKEVAMTIGEVPEVVKPGVVYGDLLNMMRPKGNKPAGSSQAADVVKESKPQS